MITFPAIFKSREQEAQPTPRIPRPWFAISFAQRIVTVFDNGLH
jgi:hypothetical protein